MPSAKFFTQQAKHVWSIFVPHCFKSVYPFSVCNVFFVSKGNLLDLYWYTEVTIADNK